MDFLQKLRLKPRANPVALSPRTNGVLEPVSPQTQKRVTFSTEVHVVLIPTKEEFIDANLFDAIWLNQNDYTLFKSQSRDELESCMQECNIDSIRDAATRLYQPT